MTTTLRMLAELVDGEIFGAGDLEIHSAAPLRDAGPGEITLVANEKYLAQGEASPASAFVVPLGMSIRGKSLIRVADPLGAFAAITQHLHGLPDLPIHGIDPRSDVHPTAQIGPGASIHAFAVVGPGCVIGPDCRLMSGATLGRFCQLGANVTLHPNVVMYDNTLVGSRVIVHANSVIGADGFGYRLQQGRHVKVPQLGHVELGDDVEIGACTTIDRGTFGATKIGTGTKIDNLVQVAHNCRIGQHNIFVSQMGMAGSSSTGDYVVIAGQVGIVDHIHIGDRSVIGGQAAVTKDVASDSRMLGSPATPEREQKKILMSLLRLPEIRKELREIQERLGLAG